MNFEYQTVNLISWTTSKLANHNQDDGLLLDLIAYVARVSNPSNQGNFDTSEKLIKYLIKHKHWSPFEMANVCLEINTTRDIGRQILRHRSFSYQEFSQRYADPTKDLNFITREARLQDLKNRQSSIDVEDSSLQARWEVLQEEIIEAALDRYQWAIRHGIAKEQARAVLPEGLVMSRLYMNGSIRSWLHYLELRTTSGTQKEHRDVAKKCGLELIKVFPNLWEFIENEN